VIGLAAPRRWSLVPALLALTMAGAGCGSSLTPPEPSSEPYIYLVLGQTVAYPREPRQLAFLLTTGTPTRSDYLEADTFEMRRVADGALFDWRSLGLEGEAPVSVTSADLIAANYILADTATTRGLGYPDVRPGGRYNLTIVAGEHTLHGSVTVPDTFRIEFRDERRSVVWPSARGAAGYSVALTAGGTTLQTDTTFRIPSTVTSGSIFVTALDSNLYDYMVRDELPRSGIDAGFGVFGAAIRALPPLSGGASIAAGGPHRLETAK